MSGAIIGVFTKYLERTRREGINKSSEVCDTRKASGGKAMFELDFEG